MSTRHGSTVHFNVNDPEDLRRVTISGVIWKTPYAQKALDAIEAGKIKVSDLKNVPPQIAAALAKDAGGPRGR